DLALGGGLGSDVVCGDSTEVGGVALAGHKPGVGTDGGLELPRHAGGDGAGFVHTDQGGGAGLEIALVKVDVVVLEARNQVGGITVEQHVAPIAAEQGVGRTAIGSLVGGSETSAGQDGSARSQVAHVDIFCIQG